MQHMLGVVMFARGMREEDIVPAIMTGELPKNRGRVKAYENFEMLHEQLLEQWMAVAAAIHFHCYYSHITYHHKQIYSV